MKQLKKQRNKVQEKIKYRLFTGASFYITIQILFVLELYDIGTVHDETWRRKINLSSFLLRASRQMPRQVSKYQFKRLLKTYSVPHPLFAYWALTVLDKMHALELGVAQEIMLCFHRRKWAKGSSRTKT